MEWDVNLKSEGRSKGNDPFPTAVVDLKRRQLRLNAVIAIALLGTVIRDFQQRSASGLPPKIKCLPSRSSVLFNDPWIWKLLLWILSCILVLYYRSV